MTLTKTLHDDAVPASKRQLASKALPEHNRRHNRALALQLLIHRGPRSRADIARETGLARITVGDLVAELENEGLVRELGPRQDGRPGKPATLLDVATDNVHIAAVDLSPGDRFVGAIMNLRGQIQHRIEQPLCGATGELAIGKVLDLTAALLSASGARVLGIGIGTPGIVDHAGIIREAPNLGWYNVDIGERIRSAFNYPVDVANDANAAALGVLTFDPASDGSVMVIRIEHGVGAGLVIDGKLVQGGRSAAGEIGHVVVDDSGQDCACGRRGCLELVLAAPRLKERLAGLDRAAMEQVLRDTGLSLGLVLSPIVSVLNMKRVVLSGPADLVEGPLLETAQQTIRSRTIHAIGSWLDLRFSSGDEDLVLLGATALVLQSQLGVS